MRRALSLSICSALALIRVGADPSRAAEALVTNQPGDSLSFVDLGTMKETARIAIGGKPAGIALSPDKRRAYVAAPDGREVIEVDAEKREILRRLKLGGGPLGIAAHPSKPEVYVADWYLHKIVVVDAATMTVAGEIGVGQSPSGLAVTPDGSLLLSADRDSNQVSFIDVATRKVVATVPTGARPFGITIDDAGNRAYTANVASDDITVIDVAQRAPLPGTVKVGRRPYALALTAGKAFVTDQYSGTVTVFDAATHSVMKAIDACDHPEGIEASITGDILVACWGDDILLRIDSAALKVTARAKVGSGPRAFGRFLR